MRTRLRADGVSTAQALQRRSPAAIDDRGARLAACHRRFEHGQTRTIVERRVNERAVALI
ncbi:hypothetical protein [Solimonas marina]|uniref:Uncharacterized protein n=1 Tax=Solimonas marina TaxID=2714601 RepID=A0A969WCT9_9GAMM|nr:hypothetical protein [Solimonas marina]NKF23740.1 hypothetical protein [Solimonas marina]